MQSLHKHEQYCTCVPTIHCDLMCRFDSTPRQWNQGDRVRGRCSLQGQCSYGRPTQLVQKAHEKHARTVHAQCPVFSVSVVNHVMFVSVVAHTDHWCSTQSGLCHGLLHSKCRFPAISPLEDVRIKAGWLERFGCAYKL